jgi:hypothetical protein
MLRFGIWVRKEHLCREEPFPWIFIGWQPFSLRVQPEWTTGTQSQRTSITPSLSPLQLTPQTHPATGRRALALTRSNEWRTDRHSHGRERSVDGRERSAVIFRNSVPVECFPQRDNFASNQLYYTVTLRGTFLFISIGLNWGGESFCTFMKGQRSCFYSSL